MLNPPAAPRHRRSALARTRRSLAERARRLTSGLTALALVGLGVPGLAGSASAATGDFSLDFVAAAPGSYNHLTGGGAYDDRTIGRNADVVESLEGEDFQCGDIVTYFVAVTVDDTASAVADEPQTIEVGLRFLMDTTGQPGVAIGDITYVGVNYGPIEDLIAGEDGVDGGNADDGGSTATLLTETRNGSVFSKGATLDGVVQVTDLEAGEQVIVRIDTQLYCQVGANPTGNLQADLRSATLVAVGGAPVTPAAISAGNQTIPLKQIDNLQYPEIEVQKTVMAAGGTCPGVESLTTTAGSSVTYCYVITNAGNAPLYNLTLVDDNATPGSTGDDFAVTLTGRTDEDADGQADDLAEDGTVYGQATVTLASGLAAGTWTNTATASGQVAVYLGSGVLTDTDTASVVIAPAPAIDIQKTPDTQTVVDGQSATFTITVTNTGNVPLTAVTVTDPRAPSCDRVIGPLAVGATTSYTCTVVITANMTNVANVTGMYGTTPVSDSDDAAVLVDRLPTVTVTKTGTPTSVPETGGSVSFTFTVQNTSGEPVTITALGDDRFGVLLGDADCMVGTVLAAGASCSFSQTFLLAGDFGSTHVNVFTATVVDGTGNTATDTDDETITYTDVMPTITVTKTGSPTSVPETGGSVTFTYVVTSTSAEPLRITALSDDAFGTLTGDADCMVGTVLAAGASCSFDATFPIPAGDVPGSHVNIFTATATDDENNPATDTDDETIVYTDVAPAVTVTKTAGVLEVPESGGPVTFTYSVVNNSTEAGTITVLADDRFGVLAGDGDCQVGTIIPAGGSCSFQAMFTVPAGDYPGSHVNVFTATLTDDDGGTATDTDDATVTYTDVLPMVTVTKSAGTVGVPETGGPVTFTYTVTNDATEAAAIAVLSDDRFGTLTGDGDCAVGTVLPAGGSCTFQTTFAIPAGDYPADHVNVFTAVVTDDDQNTATDTDDATVTYTDVLPTVAVMKTAGTLQVPESGGPVTFRFMVTNTGLEAATITTLSDDRFGTLTGDADCMVGTVLAGGASCSFEAIFAIPAGDVPGSHVNVFTAVVADDEQNTATDTDDATVTYTDVLPGVTVTKTASTGSVPETGGPVSFTYTVTNDSDESVTVTALADDRFGALVGDSDCRLGTVLPAGGSCTFDATFAIPAGDVPGSHTNVFSATVVDDEENPATDTDDETVWYSDVPPTVTVLKTASSTTVPETGGPVSFTYTVTNTSAESVTVADLTDDRFGILTGDADCKVGTVLAAGGSCTFEATFAIPAGDVPGSHVNVFTATVTDDENNDASDTDDATVTYTDVLPGVTVTKTAGTLEVPETGGTVTFTYTVTSTSLEAVTIIELTDDQFGTLDGDADCEVGTVLVAGGSCSFEATFDIPAGDYPASHVNVFTAVVTDDDDNTATDTDDETVGYGDVAPVIQVTKTSDLTSVPETGRNVVFTFVVTNTGAEDVTLTSLVDSVFGDLDAQGTCAVPQEIPVGGTYTCQVTVFLSSDSLTDHTNVVTAVAEDDDGTESTDTDDETVTFTDVAPIIRMTKTVDRTSVPETGADVTFTFLVENVGVEDVTLTSLNDTVFGDLDGKGTCEVPQEILVGDSYTCVYVVFMTGDDLGGHYNVVTAIAEDDEGTETTDDDDIEILEFVDLAPEIQITKTANPTAVPETGANVTFTFLVQNIGVEDVTLTTLTDSVFGDLDGKGTCDVPQTILIGAAYSCTYVVFLSSATLAPHVNLVTGSAVDDDGTTTTDTDDAAVTFVATPPIPVVTVITPPMAPRVVNVPVVRTPTAPRLAETGFDAMGLAGIALVLTAAGALLVGRRRSGHHSS